MAAPSPRLCRVSMPQFAAGLFSCFAWAGAGAIAFAADDLSSQALSQARDGDLAAALQTAARMPDDVERTATLDQLHSLAAAGRSASADQPAVNSASGATPLGGAAGGGQQADFETLIELITTTIAPTSWDEVGGSGSINPFPTGVLIDADGLLRATPLATDAARLARMRAERRLKFGANETSTLAPLRKVSLPRLEKQIQLRRAAGLSPDAQMQALAGLERIEYVFVYPESGDLVIAGPAGPWHVDALGQPVSSTKGRPTLRLDDLVVLLRHFQRAGDGTFGCAITPTAEGLAAAKAWLESPERDALRGRPDRVFGEVRRRLGRQTIEVFGLDPNNRAARVMVEADYHMKLVGLGLAPTVPGLVNYLDSFDPGAPEAPPSLDVLRWWFTLDVGAVAASADRRAFAFAGRLVRLQSENEMLGERGERIHTGKSDPLNRRFTQAFTEAFPQLAEKYPVYADLENIFALALVAALVERAGLAEECRWHQTGFGDNAWYEPAVTRAPAEVESVSNHRVVTDRAARKRYTIGAVSGGVRVDVAGWFREHETSQADQARLEGERHSSAPTESPTESDIWWWD